MSVDNYCIVQTLEDGEHFLSVLPSKWVVKNGWKNVAGCSSKDKDGYDLCFWPKSVAGYRLFEKAKKDPTVPVDRNHLFTHRCKIKRRLFKTYSEAFREQKAMEVQSDTEEYEPKKTLRKDNSTAKLFATIQASKSKEPARPIRPVSPSPSTPAYDTEEQQVKREASHQVPNDPPEDALRCINEEITIIRQELDPVRCEVAKLVEMQNNSNVDISRCVSLLSQLNAKIDILAVQKLPSPSSCDQVQLRKIPITAVSWLVDLENLEKNSKDTAFVHSVVESLGSIHGKGRCRGDGWSVCLQLVDYFFDREFMMQCSWTGTSRNKNDESPIVSKITFHKYEKVIDLFYQVIIYADPDFSFDDCQKFLHRCLKNAKQRYEEIKGTRKSVARKRCKQVQQASDAEKDVETKQVQQASDAEKDVETIQLVEPVANPEMDDDILIEKEDYDDDQNEIIVEEYVMQDE